MQQLKSNSDIDVLSTTGFNVVELVLTSKDVRAKIDIADLPKVLSVSTRWHAHYCSKSKTHYARATRRKVSLHRVVTECPPHLQVDHQDHDGLNNRRCNLRNVTQSVNSANGRYSLGVTGFRNVTAKSGRFRASLMVNMTRVVLGLFPTPQGAATAVREYREKAGLL